MIVLVVVIFSRRFRNIWCEFYVTAAVSKEIVGAIVPDGDVPATITKGVISTIFPDGVTYTVVSKRVVVTA